MQLFKKVHTYLLCRLLYFSESTTTAGAESSRPQFRDFYVSKIWLQPYKIYFITFLIGHNIAKTQAFSDCRGLQNIDEPKLLIVNLFEMFI